MPAEPTPFRLTVRQQLASLGAFREAHQAALGRARGLLGLGATLGRFLVLRARTGRTDAPMVDDAVAMAVATYRTLRRRLPEGDALAAVEAAVVASGLELMAAWVPDERDMGSLGRQVRVVMGDAERRGVYAIDGMSTTDTGLRWDMTACRYAELTRRLGAPEVGRVFCAVDQPFVRDVVPDLAFSCATTIARGDDRCRFRVGDEARP